MACTTFKWQMKILCESAKYFIIPIVSSDRYISCWLSFSFFICVCVSVSDCCLSQYSTQTFPFYFYARFCLSTLFISQKHSHVPVCIRIFLLSFSSPCAFLFGLYSFGWLSSDPWYLSWHRSYLFIANKTRHQFRLSVWLCWLRIAMWCIRKGKKTSVTQKETQRGK